MAKIGETKKPVTWRQQLTRRPQHRNGNLEMERKTNKGHLIRAKEILEWGCGRIINYVLGIDRIRGNEVASTVIRDIKLSSEQIILVKIGNRKFRLFPLTVGFLKQFSEYVLVEEILKRHDNPQKTEDRMVTWVNLEEALGLLEIINPRLLDNIRLRLPAEILVDNIFTAPEHAELRAKKPPQLLTASKYDAKGVKKEEFDIELISDEIKESDDFTYRYGYDSKEKGCYITGRFKVGLHGLLNTGVMFEVLS